MDLVSLIYVLGQSPTRVESAPVFTPFAYLAIFLGIGFWLLTLFVMYMVIKMAVRDGIREVLSTIKPLPVVLCGDSRR